MDVTDTVAAAIVAFASAAEAFAAVASFSATARRVFTTLTSAVSASTTFRSSPISLRLASMPRRTG